MPKRVELINNSTGALESVLLHPDAQQTAGILSDLEDVITMMLYVKDKHNVSNYKEMPKSVNPCLDIIC